LIVSIGTEIYVTLAKGPVVGKESPVPGVGHVLLIPITHYPTFGKIPTDTQIEVIAELEKYKSSLKQLFDQYDQDLVMFEVSRDSFRGMAHAHIQIVPVPKNKSDQVEKVAKEQAALAGIDLIDQVPVSTKR
jgi:diadenosine tetraphosphate (Ap4A) HIT family hydrolase